jgi:hypothetical protein
MNSQSIIRYGGIAAIVSAVLYIVSMGLWMGAGEAGSPPPAAAAAYAASSLVFIVTLVALYVFHRSTSPGLSLAATLLLAVALVAGIFVDPTDMTNPVIMLMTACYGVGSLLLAWLAFRSAHLPRGVAILLLLIGVASLVMILPMVTGAADLVNVANLLIGILYIVWALWLGWVFIRGMAAMSQPA